MALGLAAVLLSGAEASSAFLAVNTIDEHATYKKHGTLVRVSGPIACTRGERISIRITVTQPTTTARARSRWKGRCTGKLRHWRAGRAPGVGPALRTAADARALSQRRELDRASPTRGDGASA